MDIVEQYFSDKESQHCKISIVILSKDEVVFPQSSRRRNSLHRYVSAKTDKAIKDGSQKDSCQNCEYLTSRKKMRVHLWQLYIKHFCSCGCRSASYDLIYNHHRYRLCTATTTDIYEVDRNSYLRFLRHCRMEDCPTIWQLHTYIKQYR